MLRCGNIVVVLTVIFLDVGKFVTTTPLSLKISDKFSFPIAVLQIISFIPFGSMNFESNDMKPMTSQYYV
jgi:hypothetical protein